MIIRKFCTTNVRRTRRRVITFDWQRHVLVTIPTFQQQMLPLHVSTLICSEYIAAQVVTMHPSLVETRSLLDGPCGGR